MERRIQKAEEEGAQSPEVNPERPSSILPLLWGDHVKLMFDLQVLAFQADITRVITFQLAREASSRTYPEIGVPDAHHPTSHHRNKPEQMEKLAKINSITCRLCSFLESCARSRRDGSRLSGIYMGGSGWHPDVTIGPAGLVVRRDASEGGRLPVRNHPDGESASDAARKVGVNSNSFATARARSRADGAISPLTGC